MVYNTENRALLQKLPDKSQILRKKIMDIIVGNCGEIESKTLNTFQKLLE